MPHDGETWATALERLALLLGGRSGQFQAEAEEWLRQAVGGRSLYDLTRNERGLAFRRLLAVVDDLADGGEIAFDSNIRGLVASTIARHFGIEPPDGPEWRLAPTETSRPTYIEAIDDSLPI